MIKDSTKISAISKIYADALFNTAAENGLFELYKNQLAQVLEVLEFSDDLRIVAANSSISLLKKIEIFKAVFGGKIDEKLLNFLIILLEKGRFGDLASIYRAYDEKIAQKSNLKVVEVFSPIKLNFENKSNVLFKLEHKLGCEVVPVWKIDESLIAGLAFKFDDTVIDTSIKAKLKDLVTNITR